MKIRLLAVGSRTEPWVRDGFQAYVERFPREIRLELVELPLSPRPQGAGSESARRQEGERLLQRIKPRDYVLALDERGRQWSSTDLASQLKKWLQEQPELTLVIGGPDGLTDSVRQRAEGLWSLSPLTFPHGLVRVLVAEQIYRAWTILQGHPYHKA